MNLPTAQTQQIEPATLASVMLDGNLAKLSDSQRVDYMASVCRSLGLTPLTKPFEFITLNGKLTMYAKRDCTEQLRKIHGVSVTISARDTVNEIFIVTARAQDATGRVDESTGAVSLKGLQGENLANAFMKAETKAKRRVTLSICGLGMLDETEAESLADKPQQPVKIASVTGEVKKKKPEYSDDQKKRCGEAFAEVRKLGGQTGTDEVNALWSRMAYDDPETVIEAAEKLRDVWIDIDMQAKREGTIQ